MNEPARSESLDARAWWTLAVVVAVVLIAYLGLSAGRMSSHEEARPPASQSKDPSTTASSDTSGGSTTAAPTEVPSGAPSITSSDDEIISESTGSPTGSSSGTPIDSGSEPLDAQSLRDFGELGVLPGLLDDFSSVPDCDFDDALSTCQ